MRKGRKSGGSRAKNSGKGAPRTSSKSGDSRAAHTPRKSRASRARVIAYKVCSQVEANNSFTRDVLNAQIKREREGARNHSSGGQNGAHALSNEDAAFATTLTLGVVQTSGVLDALINRVLKSPKDINNNVRCALRISTYEIIYLEKDAFAAVHQGVELVRTFCPKAAGVANFTLRRIAELKSSFPFGDPENNFDAFVLKEAFPLALAQTLVQDLGLSYARTLMHTANTQAPLFIALNYVKTTDAEVREKLEAANIAFEQVSAEILEGTRDECDAGRGTESSEGAGTNGNALAGCYKLHDARSVTHPAVKQLIAEGKILVADAASQCVASLVSRVAFEASCNSWEFCEGVRSRQAQGGFAAQPQVSLNPHSAPAQAHPAPNHNGLHSNAPSTKVNAPRVLEIGAGRATKTVLMQSAAWHAHGAQIDLTCIDNSEYKVNILRDRAKTYSTHVSSAYVTDGTCLSKCGALRQSESFDVVFLDAPCTGLGTLRRHPEIRWRITPQAIKDAAQLQLQMLRQAAQFVRPSGALVYSTCTITREENEGVIDAFLKTAAESTFEVVPYSSTSPYFATKTRPQGPDAHFAACMIRKA